jgi:hypothetical protein
METDLIKLIKRINERVVPIDEPIEPASEVARTNDDDIADGPVLKTGKRARPIQPGPRRQERLESARKALSNWCLTLWNAAYSHCVWGPEVLLPDTVLTKLASRARIKTISDIKNEVPEWPWADEYGDIVLKLLEAIDSAWHEENERKKVEKKAKRAKISAGNKVKREGDRLDTAQQERGLASLAHHPSGPSYPSSQTYSPSSAVSVHMYDASTYAYHPTTNMYHANSQIQFYDPSTEAYHPRLVPSTEAYYPSTQAYQPSQAYDTSVQQQQSAFSCFSLEAHSGARSEHSYSSTPHAGSSTGAFNSFQLAHGPW